MVLLMPATQWNASDYAGHSRGQLEWALHNMDRLKLPADAELIDLGCGDGKVTAELARLVPKGRVVGIDKSPEMIKFAKSTWCPEVSNIDFQLADVQSFELPGVFDLAFSNSTLHWVPDHLAVLKCVSRVLKPAGRVVFSMGGRGTAATAFRALEKFSHEGQWAGFLTGIQSPHYFFGPEEYNQWLPQAGLEAIRSELVAKPMRHENTAMLEGWLRTTWMPYTEPVPRDQRDQFLCEFAAEVRSGCNTTDDGAILMPMVNLEVEATKIVD